MIRNHLLEKYREDTWIMMRSRTWSGRSMRVVVVGLVGLKSLRVWFERRYGCRSADAVSLEPGDK